LLICISQIVVTALTQGRFRNLFEEKNKWMLDRIQQGVDKNWQRIVNMERATNPEAPTEDPTYN